MILNLMQKVQVKKNIIQKNFLKKNQIDKYNP